MTTVVLCGQPLTQTSRTVLQRRAQTTQPFKPAAQRVAVVTLASECVMSAEAVMDVGGTVLENGAVVMGVDAFEILPRDRLTIGWYIGYSSSHILTLSNNSHQPLRVV